MSSTTKPETDVLIVGAGPAGLTLACELLRRGVRCRIIDKAPAPATTSHALDLQPRTLELFRRVGETHRREAEHRPGRAGSRKSRRDAKQIAR